MSKWFLSLKLRNRNHKAPVLAFILIFCITISSVSLDLDRTNELQVVFLNVGQGDSIVIKAPKGQSVIIDTGQDFKSFQKFEKVSHFLDKNFIDLILLTHPDMDHFGGATHFIKNISIEFFGISSKLSYDLEIQNTQKGSAKKLTKSDYFDFGDGLKLEIRSPESWQTGAANSLGVISDMTYGDYHFIFMADAGLEEERRLISQGVFENNKKKVLKIGHHGSKSSSGEYFLKKIKPDYCIISVGRNNTYNHPDELVLARLAKHCKNLYRTDSDGDISFSTDGSYLNIERLSL